MGGICSPVSPTVTPGSPTPPRISSPVVRSEGAERAYAAPPAAACVSARAAISKPCICSTYTRRRLLGRYPSSFGLGPLRFCGGGAMCRLFPGWFRQWAI
jgi:hypothetical protein